MGRIVTSGVTVASNRELKNSVEGVEFFTLPVADVIYGRVIFRYGIAITCTTKGEPMTAVACHMDAAWQSVTGLDLTSAVQRAKAVFPVGLSLRYGNVFPGLVIQLADDDARDFGCELSYVQAYDLDGHPAGAPIDGCIAVTERAMFLAYQQSGLMPALSSLTPSRADAAFPVEKVIAYNDIKDGAAHVQSNGPLRVEVQRTYNGVSQKRVVDAFPSGDQRAEAEARRREAVQSVRTTSRLSSLMSS